MLPALYHAHHNRNLEDIPFWFSLAAGQAGEVLELGCGTGRVLVPLVGAGCRMVGLDNDLAMLEFLKSNIEMPTGMMPILVLADISQFYLAFRFGLVILPCNTYSTLKEPARRGCLECTRRHLKTGGIFSFSVPNPQALMKLPDQSDPELEDEFPHPLTGNPVQVSSGWQRAGNSFTVSWLYDHLLPDGRVERIKVDSTHQLITVDKYEREINAAGMKIHEMYGDFNHSAYRADSPHLILVAEAVY